MSETQQPNINVSIKKGDTVAGVGEQKVLIVSQGVVAKDIDYGKVFKNVQPGEVESLVGVGSLVTRAYKRFRKYNKQTEVDLAALKNPNGSKAEGAVAVSGVAAETKTLRIYIADDEYFVDVEIATGDTDKQVATKIGAAVNAKFDVASEGKLFASRVDNSGAKGVAKVKFGVSGEFVNRVGFRIPERVKGLDITSNLFSAGAGAYDMVSMFDDIQERYQTVVFDECVDEAVVEKWLEARINLKNAVKGGVGVYMQNKTLSVATAYAKTKNSKVMVYFANVDEMKYNCLPILACAEFAAKRSLRLTQGAVLGSLTLDPAEAFGGVNKNSLPYHNTPMSYPKANEELTFGQLESLNKAGASVFVPSATNVVLGSVVTMYKTDGAGVADTTFKYLNSVDTSFAVQEFLFNNCKQEFGQTRMTEGALVPEVSMTNALSVKAFIVGLYETLVSYALAQGGEDALKAFRKSLKVTADTATGTYSVNAPVAIVAQLRTLNAVVEISYEF